MDIATLTETLEDIRRTGPERVRSAADLDALEAARVELLGRKGRLTELLKSLKDLSDADKRSLGPRLQSLKAGLQDEIDAKRRGLEDARVSAQLESARIDRTLPPPPLPDGRLHPITATIDEVRSILSRLGFATADGPLIESEYYNFEALNIPEEHSARDMQDTFYLDGLAPDGTKRLLRTHTSNVQIRYMEKNPPPVRVIAPGRVFRHEAVDAGHSAVFYQIEGLYVDRRVTMADLKATIQAFIRGLFGPSVKTRLRPSYFPFTEPSAEFDMSCLLCAGAGCSACKQSGWMELGGCGLVHPQVLRFGGCDPAAWTGFAFGFGVERIAMLRCGIPDIRLFYENDVRFLEQFR